MCSKEFILKENNGFTLIEMVIVIVIAGTLLAAGATGMKALLQETEHKTTKTGLDTLHSALALHHTQSGTLPCPASLTVTSDTSSYGVADDCVSAPAAGLTRTNGRGGRKVRIGMIPFKSLNLPEEIAYDAWGRRLTYAVTEKLATTPADFDPQEGAIVVQDSNGNDLTEKPGNGMYVIFSGGEDGLGAYARNGTVFDACIGDGNAHDGENCDNDAVFVKTEFSTAETTSHYDDVFAYASRILGEDDSSPDPIFNCTDQGKIFLPTHPDSDNEGCANIFPTCAAEQVITSDSTTLTCVDENNLWRVTDPSQQHITNKNFGNIGIGTETPQAKLDVRGGIKIANDSASCDANKEGTIRYNTGRKNIEFCDGSQWKATLQRVRFKFPFSGGTAGVTCPVPPTSLSAKNACTAAYDEMCVLTLGYNGGRSIDWDSTGMEGFCFHGGTQLFGN